LIQNTQESLTNLKFLLLCFELLSGMQINFHKNEVIVMGVGEAEQARVARLLNCKQGKFPFTYLGFTMSDHKLTMADVEPLVASVGKRAAPWQGRFMSSTARLTLIDACLSNLPLHTMGLFCWPMDPMLRWTVTGTNFSGRDRAHQRNSIWSIGKPFANPKARVAWGC
jgi:hypothetical protein